METGSANSMLDIIANAVGYCNLLERHIEKENSVVYPYAEKNLDPNVIQQMTELAKKMNQKDFFMEQN